MTPNPMTPAARAKQAHKDALAAIAAHTAENPDALATLPAGTTVTASEVYAAAVESCSRFYVANGGSTLHAWTVQPYPGTAAISFDGWNTWTLCLPAMPLDARLSRREGELIVAFIVHELGHALFTDFDVFKRACREGLKNLVNALEDIRIERDLIAGAKGVSNARALLQMLTEYMTIKSLANGWRADEARCLPFTLASMGAVNVLGYTVPAMPRLDVLPPAIQALAGEAIDRVRRTRPGKAGTLECLAIAQWLRDAIDALAPQDKQAPGAKPQQGKGGAQDGEDEAQDGEAQDGEAQDGEGEAQDGEAQAQGEAKDGEADKEAPATEASEKPQDAQESEDEGQAAPGAAANAGDASEGEDGPAESMGGPEAGGGGQDAWNVDDAATENPEANLDDLGERASKRNGATPDDVRRENAGVMHYLNAKTCRVVRHRFTADETLAARLTALIPTPAKLRRDVTRALKSPDMAANHRHEARGRFDMRDVSRAQAGAVNVFRRREETPGENTAVALLLDCSSSMQGGTMQGAVALALHLGDACKAASIPFEVLGFISPRDLRFDRPTASLLEVKSFRDPWQAARAVTAAMVNAPSGGTSMMPAMIDTAKRLKARSGVTRRVMIVLTDGEDTWARQSIRAAAKTALARDGVETLIIGAFMDVKPLGLPHVNVSSLKALASKGLEALGEALAAKPRAA
jgi:hypothetical protein